MKASLAFAPILTLGMSLPASAETQNPFSLDSLSGTYTGTIVVSENISDGQGGGRARGSSTSSYC